MNANFFPKELFAFYKNTQLERNTIYTCTNSRMSRLHRVYSKWHSQHSDEHLHWIYRHTQIICIQFGIRLIVQISANWPQTFTIRICRIFAHFQMPLDDVGYGATVLRCVGNFCSTPLNDIRACRIKYRYFIESLHSINRMYQYLYKSIYEELSIVFHTHTHTHCACAVCENC